MIAKPPAMVAEQILWIRREVETTPMHVIKLVYLCHGWMLGIKGCNLINEPAEAWQYGPVVPSTYHRYKSFGGNPITAEPLDRTTNLDAGQNELVEAVVQAYREYTGWMLSSITHQPDTPWAKVYKNGRGEGAIIPNELIQRHYKDRVNA